MTERSTISGWIAIVFSITGIIYCARSLLLAIQNGYSTGKVGAIYHTGTIQYAAFIVFCIVGIVLMIFIGYLGLCWAGIFKERD